VGRLSRVDATTGQQRQATAQVDQQHGETCPATHAEENNAREERKAATKCIERFTIAHHLLWKKPEVSGYMRQRHFLPRKPGVYAYAAEWLIRIFMIMTAHSDNLLRSEWCGDCILMLRY
jgi:hypothetical protein